MTTREIKRIVSIPKGYRRVRTGERIPADYLIYPEILGSRWEKRLYTTKEILEKISYAWVGNRINKLGSWTPFFVRK